MTSLAFMFVLVPEPVWKMSRGKWASVCAVCDFGAGALNCRRHVGIQLTQIEIDSSGRSFDQPDCAG